MTMVFTITFNNITAISYRSALLVEEVTDKLYYIMLYQVHIVMIRYRTHNISGNIY